MGLLVFYDDRLFGAHALPSVRTPPLQGTLRAKRAEAGRGRETNSNEHINDKNTTTTTTNNNNNIIIINNNNNNSNNNNNNIIIIGIIIIIINNAPSSPPGPAPARPSRDGSTVRHARAR